MLEKHPSRELQAQITERKFIFSRPDRLHDPLYVITPIFNATRYRSRWRLYEDFAKHVHEAGAVLITVEAAFGARDFAVTQVDDPFDIQIRTESEIWLKENMINLGFQRAAALGAKYIAWVDGDTQFARADWADETLHQLQHYNFVQMWSQYQDLTPDHELVGTAHSFADNYVTNGYTKPQPPGQGRRYCYPYGKRGYPGAPGLAWAARREALDAVGGLIDICILGACDWYMAHGLIGKLDDVLRREYHPRYSEMMIEWQARAARLKNSSKLGIMGVVKGLALHFWHGKKIHRKYGTRDQILIRHGFNPDLDLKRDVQGLYQLTTRNPQMAEEMRRYFRERNEDGIDL
ncbi:MAG TPA: hypothetical protein VGH22_21190 [Candidatus Binatia bacterium]|jgi:hypothetical protein